MQVVEERIKKYFDLLGGPATFIQVFNSLTVTVALEAFCLLLLNTVVI
jgi:ABC-type transporter lipoprotein component MlaA